jgi:hypothetical protein
VELSWWRRRLPRGTCLPDLLGCRTDWARRLSACTTARPVLAKDVSRAASAPGSKSSSFACSAPGCRSHCGHWLRHSVQARPACPGPDVLLDRRSVPPYLSLRTPRDDILGSHAYSRHAPSLVPCAAVHRITPLSGGILDRVFQPKTHTRSPAHRNPLEKPIVIRQSSAVYTSHAAASLGALSTHGEGTAFHRATGRRGFRPTAAPAAPRRPSSRVELESAWSMLAGGPSLFFFHSQYRERRLNQ